MRVRFLFAFLAIFIAAPAMAQDDPGGIQGDALMSMQDVRNKVLALIEAVPDDKLSWRPDEGVRSISEVMAHIAAANYFIGAMLGPQVPEGVNAAEFEKNLTDKASLTEAVTESFDHVEAAIQGLPDESLEEPVQWFGGTQRPRRTVLHFMSIHAHEHLGQLIAYARTNEVVPPWSN